ERKLTLARGRGAADEEEALGWRKVHRGAIHHGPRPPRDKKTPRHARCGRGAGISIGIDPQDFASSSAVGIAVGISACGGSPAGTATGSDAGSGSVASALASGDE